MNNMIVCYAKLRVSSECRADFVRSCERYQQESAAEDGCIYFHYSVDLLDPDVIYANELWETRSTLDAHEQAPHYFVRRDEIVAMDVAAEMVGIYEVGHVLEHGARTTSDQTS